MLLWLIPMLYTVAGITAGLILPRLEHAYFANYTENIAVGSALAFFSSLDHLTLGIRRSSFDQQDRAAALQEDRQGLDLSRRCSRA